MANPTLDVDSEHCQSYDISPDVPSGRSLEAARQAWITQQGRNVAQVPVT